MDPVVEVPFWKDCTPGFLTQIVLNLEVRVYMPDDYVVRRREIGNEMLMINRGYCKLSRTSWYAVDGEMTISKTMLSSYDLDRDADPELNEFSESEGESDNDMSSDDEDQTLFGTGMFGDSRRFSGNAFGLPDDQLGDFTDVHRFQNVYPRRPSYPSSTGIKRSKKYQEYMHPGQVFGEMGLLMNYKRTANIRAITFVEMCVLSRESFQRIISRYPEDRRRVLTKMLETCIEKKVIPLPWENINEAVSAKRRNNGKKDISRASVIATMATKEAARILGKAIDINAPDETIKYGFQSFDQQAFRISLCKWDRFLNEQVGLLFSFNGILNVECTIRPPISNKEPIPLDATAIAIFPDTRTFASKCLIGVDFPVPPGPSMKKSLLSAVGLSTACMTSL